MLGFEPGTDSLLADWTEIGRYLERLAAASPRVRLDTIGRTTEGRPLLLATIASPTNQARLPQLREWQARMADPRGLSAAAEDSLVAAAPAVVLINNNIHSTEIASSQMQLTLAWWLATDPAWQRNLDSTVVLLVPSANPDGMDSVVSWYRRHKGTPYEGGPLPWLYHPYVGHDNNRDWFMLTQVETRALTRVLYKEWFPLVVWDVHQMGSNGARLFVPPFSDPVNPNLDPMLIQAINVVGTAMGSAVLDAGLTGVAHQQRFDLWWHGGFRTVPARHNMVGILSEAASARLASPVDVHPDSMRAPARGVNYPAPWPAGRWRMGDIVTYELEAARGLLRLVSSQRAEFVRRFVTLGRRQVAAGTAEGPAAFVIPADQPDPESVARLLNTLIATGAEVRQVAASGSEGAAFVVPLAHPYRAHVKDLLEPQQYPERRVHPGGPLEAPYDVTGWTLGLQMGVAVEPADRLPPGLSATLDTVPVPAGRVLGSGDQWILRNAANAESGIIAGALAAGARARVARGPLTVGGTSLGAGAVVVDRLPAGAATALATAVRASGVTVWRAAGLELPGDVGSVERLPRIGLYRSWTASMDEGWTRWVLESWDIPFQTVTDADIKSGNLKQRIDILVLPELSERDIRQGRSTRQTPPEYAGGLGEDGVRQVTDFVRAGGSLVAIGSSSDFAISALNLPVRNILAQGADSARGSRFSAPGSIFGVSWDPGALPLTSGLPERGAAFFDDGQAFEVTGSGVVAGRYADQPLLSGFVSDPAQVAGRAAVVQVEAGRGRVVLFGFRPVHRGQASGTFKVLFNAVLLGTVR